MSGREMCYNKECTDYGYSHEGMCNKTGRETTPMANQFKIKGSAEMTVSSPNKIPARNLRMFLDKIPEDADLSITSYSGDQRDPGYTVIRASWDL